MGLNSSYDPKIFIQKRRFLVFLNPFGGQGKCLQRWETVKHFFEKSFTEVTMVLTQYREHAYNYVKEMDLKKFDAIVTVSGDGIVHEVVNALHHRKDRIDALEIPVGTIPAGKAFSKLLKQLH